MKAFFARLASGKTPFQHFREVRRIGDYMIVR